MAQLPECTKCGKYIHHGPALCLDCEIKAANKYSNLVDFADTMAQAISSGDRDACKIAMQNYYAWQYGSGPTPDQADAGMLRQK
jgi:hypothetical protein